jgi:hypothetical protein
LIEKICIVSRSWTKSLRLPPVKHMGGIDAADDHISRNLVSDMKELKFLERITSTYED